MKSAAIRLGFYMFTPLIGGAERYLRDLLWGVPRDRYTVTLLYPPWDDFERFLGLEDCPQLRARPVRILEASRREPKRDSAQSESSFSRLRRFYKSFPGSERVSPALSTSARYAFWAPNLVRLFTALRKADLDILHVVNGGYPGAASAQAAALSARRAGVRSCVMTVASTPLCQGTPLAVERRIDRMMATAVDGFIVPGSRVADALVAERGMPAAAIHQIFWGPHTPPPAPLESARDRVRKQFGIAPGAPLLVTLANFTPAKGHATVVEALARLRARGVVARALFVGEGSYRSTIMRIASEQKVQDLIVFTGYLSDSNGNAPDSLDVFAVMRAADLFVLASDHEGLPYVVLEAMSQGLPIIATDVGDMSNAVVDGQTGFLVEAKNAEVLAEAIGRVLSNRARATRMGNAGRERYLTHFTPGAMLSSTLRLYESVVDAARTPPGRKT